MKEAIMSDNGMKAPTSTSPLGNTQVKPTPLATGGISPAARAKLRDINPDATRALRDTLARQPGHDGIARRR
jgi:hypothetical protein